MAGNELIEPRGGSMEGTARRGVAFLQTSSTTTGAIHGYSRLGHTVDTCDQLEDVGGTECSWINTLCTIERSYSKEGACS